MRTSVKAVTLAELLVVLAIIAIVLGTGMAFMTESTKDLALRGSAGGIMSILRYARSTAINQHAPCSVYLDAETRKVCILTRRTLALWRFEKADATVFRMKNGPSITKARLGNGLLIAGKGYVACGDIRVLSPNQGLVVEGWFFTDSRKEQILFAKGKEYSVTLKTDGTLAGKLSDLEVKSKNVVPLNTWFHAAMVFDSLQAAGRTSLSLQVNGNLVGSTSLEADKKMKMPDTDAEFTVSAETTAFSGLVDDLRICALIEEDKTPLSDTVTLEVPDGKGLRISFDDRGRLDRTVHQSLPVIVLKAGTQEQKITLTWMGTIE